MNNVGIPKTLKQAFSSDVLGESALRSWRRDRGCLFARHDREVVTSQRRVSRIV